MNILCLVFAFGAVSAFGSARDVLIFGGTPSTIDGQAPWVTKGNEMGIRIHVLERPGFGDSPAQERSFEKWTELVADYAAKNHLSEFSIVGISGGGPHALACASLPGCKKIVLVSTAGRFAAMIQSPRISDGQREIAQLARHGERNALAKLLESKPGLKIDAVAFKQGVFPTVDELVLICQDWSFRLEDIRCDVYAFHGADDIFSPVDVIYDPEKHVPKFKKRIFEGRGHDIGRTAEERIAIFHQTQN